MSKAAIPLRCGQDMEVPEMMLNVAFDVVQLSTETGQAAKMLTPGPTMSGFKIPLLAKFGPLDEKDVIAGAVESPITVPLNKIVAVGGAELVL